MTPTLDPPTAPRAPTGPMLRVLRRMLGGPLTAVRAGPGRVLCLLGGCEVHTQVAAGLIARGLVEERATGEESSEYHLTAWGRQWAGSRAQAEPEG